MLGPMRPLGRALACFFLIALVASGVALADHLDPQERFNRADQARAKAMLLRKADFPSTFKASRPSPETHITCDALDESDLTLTGEAESNNFAGGTFLFTSVAQVYATEADARTSLRRGMSAAGVRCLRETFSRDAARSNVELLSFERISFPRVAQQSVAFRTVARTQGVRAYVDIVVMRQGRAQTGVLFTSLPQAMPRADELRYARLIADRMQRALR